MCLFKGEKAKKGVRIKPRKITVVLITDPDCKKVPRKDKRKALLDNGLGSLSLQKACQARVCGK